LQREERDSHFGWHIDVPTHQKQKRKKNSRQQLELLLLLDEK
jgi:hypothetical protein